MNSDIEEAAPPPWMGEQPEADEYPVDTAGEGLSEAPIDWWAETPAARFARLAGLAVFVERLVRSHAIPATEIPPWWYRHEPFIHELLALMQARDAAYDVNEAPSAPLTWLHNLNIARGRLRALTDRFGNPGGSEGPPEFTAVQSWAAPGQRAEEWHVQFEKYMAEQMIQVHRERADG